MGHNWKKYLNNLINFQNVSTMKMLPQINVDVTFVIFMTFTIDTHPTTTRHNNLVDELLKEKLVIIVIEIILMKWQINAKHTKFISCMFVCVCVCTSINEITLFLFLHYHHHCNQFYVWRYYSFSIRIYYVIKSE